jgi:hypothetical protein
MPGIDYQAASVPGTSFRRNDGKVAHNEYENRCEVYWNARRSLQFHMALDVIHIHDNR